MTINNIVTCKCYGRLGNNLFQMAAAIGYTKKYNVKFIAPTQFGDPSYAAYFANLPKQKVPEDAVGCVYKEPHHHYAAIPQLDNPMLDGYFQSQKYFEHAADEVRQAFKTESYPELGNMVSVHVRRGDYLHFQHQFPVMPLSYFEQAMDMFSAGTRFLIFSDDIPWCKQVFQGPAFEFSSATDPFKDLMLMASCRHHIISNSSFSWWGAWLNPSADKEVIAPGTWFGPALEHLDTKDVIPSSWKRI